MNAVNSRESGLELASCTGGSSFEARTRREPESCRAGRVPVRAYPGSRRGNARADRIAASIRCDRARGREIDRSRASVAEPAARDASVPPGRQASGGRHAKPARESGCVPEAPESGMAYYCDAKAIVKPECSHARVGSARDLLATGRRGARPAYGPRGVQQSDAHPGRSLGVSGARSVGRDHRPRAAR